MKDKHRKCTHPGEYHLGSDGLTIVRPHRQAETCFAREQGYVVARIEEAERSKAPEIVAAMNRIPANPLNTGYLHQEEMTEEEITRAERIARRLGYTQTAYTSTSALWGLFCLADRPGHREGCIIKTRELGLMFVQTDEDLPGGKS